MAGKRVLCIAPHADDETLGCGGTLLRHVAEGDEIHWLLVTAPQPPLFSVGYIHARAETIATVTAAYPFTSASCLNFSAAGLDQVAEGAIVESLRGAIARIDPEIIYLPHCGDIHSDHRVTFNCAMAVLKPFRVGLRIRRILAYETISETEQAAFGQPFVPNVFIDVSSTFMRKQQIMALFPSELQAFPLPREASAIEALARFRGATLGVGYAEAFMLVREVR